MSYFFVFIIFVIFFLFYKNIFDKYKISYIFLIPIAVKLFIALTMGHFDIYRFIVFIKFFVNNLTLNPWDFALNNNFADFPYPPLLLYIHSIIFLPFKFFINQNGLNPDVLSYALIRIPFLICDYLLMLELLKLSIHKNKPAFLLYLFNPILLFHQYYSGQLDLIPVVLFFIGFLDLYKTNKITKKFLIFTFLSIATKPFLYIYLPLLCLYILNLDKLTFIDKFKSFFYIFCLVIVAKLLELPYLLSKSYLLQMGLGGRVFLKSYAFLILYALLSLFVFFTKYKDYKKLHIILTLLIAGFINHSAGWLTWIIPFHLLITIEEKEFKYKTLWILWYMFFCIKWALYYDSPVFDSLDIFIKNYLNLDFEFGIGYPFRIITNIFNNKVASKFYKYLNKIFILISIILIYKQIVFIIRNENLKNKLKILK